MDRSDAASRAFLASPTRNLIRTRPCPGRGRPEIGFNYIPSQAGCRFWRDWNAEEIRADMIAMSAAEVDIVRFFLFWPDFEPTPGHYPSKMLDRLESMVELAAEQELQVLPSLLTVWMNGQIFDLPWRQERDFFTDDWMIDRAAELARQASQRLARFSNVFAYDIGDEILAAPFATAQNLAEAQVATWLERIGAAVRSAHPGVPLVQANPGAFTWSATNAARAVRSSCDLGAVHSFSSWTPFRIESTLSYESRLLASFDIRMAQTYWKSAVLDEFGCYGTSEGKRRDYVHSAGASAVANGASAIILWCWRDIADRSKPYDRRPDERLTGFVDTEGARKPVMAAVDRLRDCTRQVGALQEVPGDVGILLPDGPDGRDPGGYLSLPMPTLNASFVAFLLCKRAHLNVRFVRNIDSSLRMLVVPCWRRFTFDLEASLQKFVNGGGTLLYSPGSPVEGAGTAQLFGIALDDFTALTEKLGGFSLDGGRIPYPDKAMFASDVRHPIVSATDGAVVAHFDDGSPALVHQRHGNGNCFYLNGAYEESLQNLSEHDWAAPYRLAAAAAKVAKPAYTLPETVECLPFDAKAGSRRHWLLINHHSEPAKVLLEEDGRSATLAPNDFVLVAEPAARRQKNSESVLALQERIV